MSASPAAYGRAFPQISAWLIVALLLGMTVNAAGADKAKSADAIFLHGDIYTAAFLPRPAVKTVKRAQALAVRGDRIIAIGSDAEIQKLKAKNTRIVDLHGRFVMPGFNDAHTHLAYGGLQRLDVDLVGVRSLAEMQERIAAHVKLAPPGEWIVGRGWDHTIWIGQELPNRQNLDAVTADHPAVFSRVDGHIAVANSAALKAGGITASSPDPAGGKIDHDGRGEPTGILRETAKDQMLARVPKPSPERRRRALEVALAEAAKWGVTSAQDYSEWEDFLALEEIERAGKLTLRISEWLTFNDPLTVLQAHRAHHPNTDLVLRTGMLKGYMDGSLGSRTAALEAPYADDPGNRGLPQYEQSKLDRMTVDATRAGFQIGFHAIGDQASEMALDAFAEAERDARERGESRDFRFRIEHAQVTPSEQVRRFKELGVIASVQPSHLLTDMHWVESRLGKERLANSYVWKGFLDAGVPLVFGTDFPVEPINPFRGLYVAVTRRSEDGKQEFFPAQKLSIEEAIAAYTSGPAYAEFAERDKGRLVPGMLADFVVLDRDITKVAPPELLHTQVLMTVVGGKTVFEKR